MDFSLKSLRDAFHEVNFREDFYLYAFLLATESDTNIFPDLIQYFPEIHELTGKYILLIAPNIGRGEYSKDVNYDTLVNYVMEYQNREFKRYLAEQTKESLEFARFCGIPTAKMPCIVFFDSLEDPTTYVGWELRGENASSVVRDFRIIVDRLSQLLDAPLDIRDIISDYEKERRQYINELRNLETKSKKIRKENRRDIPTEVEQIEDARNSSIQTIQELTAHLRRLEVELHVELSTNLLQELRNLRLKTFTVRALQNPKSIPLGQLSISILSFFK